MIEKEEAEGPSSWEVGRRVGEEGCDYGLFEVPGEGKKRRQEHTRSLEEKEEGPREGGITIMCFCLREKGGKNKYKYKYI